MSTILNTIHTESDEYVNAVKVGGTKISFDILKRAYQPNNANNSIPINDLMTFINNIRDNMNRLLQCYEKLTEEQKNEIAGLAKLNDNSLSKYLFHLTTRN